jgi:hypothetical protein
MDYCMVHVLQYPPHGPQRRGFAEMMVVASCSVHPVSEQHRQAVQSALVRRCFVGRCIAMICLALPAMRWLDDPPLRAAGVGLRLRRRREHRAARTGKLACASPAALTSACAPCLATADAAAWQCGLRLQRCCRCCPLRSCAEGGASLGGARGCASASSARVIWLSARTLRAECILHVVYVEHADRSDRLDL